MAGSERIVPAAPLSTAAGRIIASPFQFLLEGEDSLRLTIWSATHTGRVTVQGRRLSAAGHVDAFGFDFAVGPSNSPVTYDFSVGAGPLLNVTTFEVNGGQSIGDLFVRIEVIRGLSGGTTVLGTLLQGYITREIRLAWPGSPLQSPFDGPGRVRSYAIPNAGHVGEQYTYFGPGTYRRFQLLSFAAILTTDVTAVTRIAALDLSQTAGFMTRAPSPFSQGASLSRYWVWTVGLHYETVMFPSIGVAGWPAALEAGAIDSLATVVSNFQAGDAWTDIRVLTREWINLDF